MKAVNLTDDDCRALRESVERNFDEGTIEIWPREEVMRAIGFTESHWLWEYFLRDTAATDSA